MKQILLSVALSIATLTTFAQVAIGTGTNAPSPNAKAVLLLMGNGNNQGVIIPIVGNRAAVAPSAQEKGMLVFDDSDKTIYYYNGTNWIAVSGAASAVADGSITGGTAGPGVKIAANTITDANILSLDAAKITSGTLPIARIAAGTVDNTKLATGIDASKITTGLLPVGVLPSAGGELSGTLSGLTINNNAITTTKINNGAVTLAKIGTAGLPDANKILSTDASGNPQWSVAAGGGDMLKSTYDPTNINGSAFNLSNHVGQISTAQITDANVTNIKLASGIDAAKITAGTLPGAVLPANVLLNSSTAGGELSGTLSGLSINNNAVTTAKILDANVTTAKIANGAVTAAKIGTAGLPDANKILSTDASGNPQWTVAAGGGDMLKSTYDPTNINGSAFNLSTHIGQISTAQITDANVTNVKLASGIDAAKITTGTLPGAVLPANVLLNSSTAGGELSGTLSALTINSNAVTTAKILDANVTTAKIANGAVTAAKIGTAGLPDANKILSTDASGNPQWTVAAGGGDMLKSTYDPTNINGSAFNLSTHIGQISTAQITDANVTNIKLASGIDAAKITTGTLPGAVLPSNVLLNSTTASGDLSGTYASPTVSRVNGSTWPANAAGVLTNNGSGTLTWGAPGLTNPLTTNGDIIYAVGSTPTRLAAGTGFLRGGTIPSYSAIGLGSADVTGTLAVGNGGTGLSTFGSGGLMYASGATTLGNIGNGSSGQMLLMTGSTPTWQSMGGDATINGSGALALAAGAVSGGTGGDIADGTITSADLGSGSVDLASTDVTGILPIAQGGTNSTATPTNGGVGYGTGAAHAYSAIGTPGQLLQSNGAAAPTWVNAPASFTTNNVIPKGSASGLVGTSFLFENPSGNFGIGSTLYTSEAQLHLRGATGNQLIMGNINQPTREWAWEVDPVSSLFLKDENNGSALTRLTLDQFGNMGIGTSPLERLDVAGNLKFSGALMPNNLPGTVGQVLTSAGAGQPPTWSSGGSAWGLTGNAGTLDGTSFIGTTDDVPLNFRVKNRRAGRLESSGGSVFLGYTAGENNTVGGNTGVGNQALAVNTTGGRNVAIGYESLRENTTGPNNTSVGYFSLQSNTTSGENTAIGTFSLTLNTGQQNTAVGANALSTNTIGVHNTAIGYSALPSNTTGNSNTAVGYNTLTSNTTGNYNTAIGWQADVISGNLTNATAIGYNALVATSNSMVLGSTGVNAVKVGIGTMSPSVTLDIQATDAVNMPDGTTAQRPGAPVAGAMRYNTTENVMEYYNGTNWYFVTPKVAYVKDVKTSGTSGGAISGGSWTTRNLNTIEGDVSIVSLASNQFTLSPGEYEIEAHAQANRSGPHQIRLFNNTTSSVISYGSNAGAASSGAGSSDQTTNSLVRTRFSLAASSTLIIQHYASGGGGGEYGVAIGAIGGIEVYTIVKISKLR